MNAKALGEENEEACHLVLTTQQLRRLHQHVSFSRLSRCPSPRQRIYPGTPRQPTSRNASSITSRNASSSIFRNASSISRLGHPALQRRHSLKTSTPSFWIILRRHLQRRLHHRRNRRLQHRRNRRLQHRLNRRRPQYHSSNSIFRWLRLRGFGPRFQPR